MIEARHKVQRSRNESGKDLNLAFADLIFSLQTKPKLIDIKHQAGVITEVVSKWHCYAYTGCFQNYHLYIVVTFHCQHHWCSKLLKQLKEHQNADYDRIQFHFGNNCIQSLYVTVRSSRKDKSKLDIITYYNINQQCFQSVFHLQLFITWCFSSLFSAPQVIKYPQTGDPDLWAKVCLCKLKELSMSK